MKANDFKILDEFDQFEIIEDKAVFLDQRRSGNYSIALFQVDGFYIEVFFYLIESVYKSICVFDNTSFLDPYLDLIDITELCDCRHH